MSFCLRLKFAACLAGSFVLSSAAEAATHVGQAPVRQTIVSPRVRSVVRADSRTGRLVRTVVVAPRTVDARLITAQTPALDSNSEALGSDASVPDIVEATARKYDVDPLLVHSVIQVESGYNPYAMSPKGAQGLMQLMPGTARRFGVSNSFDVRENIEGGVRYLKYLSSIFDDMRLALAAYNAGEGAVWKYNNRIPPYKETEEYVAKVGRRYGQAKRAAERNKPDPPAQTAKVVSSEPIYAPVQYHIDAEGRLHLRTATP